MSRIALVFNRGSGPGRLEIDELEAALVAEGAEVHPFTVENEDLVTILDEALAWVPHRLAVAGGDGSVGPAAAAAGAAGVPLAVIPTGTANDFARGVGLPDDPLKACRLAATGRRVRALDLGRAGGHPFVNVASAGLAVAAAEAASRPKRVLGAPAYALGALGAGLTARLLQCRVTCDGNVLFVGSAWQLIFANTGSFGGGAQVEVASPFDGRLNATVVAAGRRVRLMAHAYAMKWGRVAEQDGVVWASGRGVEVGMEGRTFNVDGEVRELSRLTFGVEPAAFRLVVGQ